MTDYTELKRLANHAIGLDDSAYIPCQVAFQRAANPHAVLALIAQIEQDETHLRAFSSVAETAIAERDQLKAENARSTEREILQLAEIEALLAAAQAIRDEWRKDQADAERYRWLRLGGYLHSQWRHMPDQTIDAAMGKGEQS